MKRHAEYGLPGPKDTGYWSRVRARAKELNADGCTGVADIYVDSCFEHDIHYRTHATLYGDPLSRADADQILRERIQEFSFLDGFSPMAWWRWAGVRLFGGPSWRTPRGT